MTADPVPPEDHHASAILEAERAVLAAMLLGEEACALGASLLEPRDFHRITHQRMFAGLCAISARGERADAITLTFELQGMGVTCAEGWPATIAQVTDYAGTAANLEDHAAIVREAAAKRRWRKIGQATVDAAMDPQKASAEILAGVRAHLEGLGAEGKDSAGDPIDFLDLDAIRSAGIPPVPWIVEGWIAEQDIALVSGDGGIGKSTTVADLGAGVALGRDWCGLKVLKPGRVLVFDEEQSVREVSRLYLRLGAPHPNLHVACQQGVNLTTQEGVRRIELVLAQHRPMLTIFDSVQQVFAGVDGNNAGEVAAVYSQLFRLRREYETTFVLIGHLRKPPSEGVASKLHLVHGSVAFSTQASTVWVATQPTRGLLDLTQVKRRDGEKTSLRVRYQAEGPDAPIVLTGEGVIEEQETITERAQDFVVRYLSTHGTSPTGWIVQAGGAEQPAIPERTVQRALKHLAGLGSVEKVRRGYYGLTGSQVYNTPPSHE